MMIKPGLFKIVNIVLHLLETALIGFNSYNMVSQQPRVTCEKLLQDCQRHACYNIVISQVPECYNLYIHVCEL